MGKPGKGARKYYLDSCVFLSLIEATPGRVTTIKSILEECEQGGCELFTSHLSIAEVAFAKAEKEGRALDPDVEDKIDELWHPDFPMQIVEVHQLIVYDAKNLIRTSMQFGWSKREQWSLKPNDAIHLVTAKRHAVDAFLTYDKKLTKYGNVTGCPVCPPVPPAQFPLIPDEPEGWNPRVSPHWWSLVPKEPPCVSHPFVPHLRRRAAQYHEPVEQQDGVIGADTV